MEHPMKVLVAAASRHGATQEIAEAIGRTLNGEGVHAEVAANVDASDPAGYDAVVLGSAVYMGHWLEAATKFVEAHGTALSARPTWPFSSGPIGDPPRPTEPAAVDVADLVSHTQPTGHNPFPCKLDKC